MSIDERKSAAPAHRAFIDPRRHEAVLFDLDGVVTDTASIHAQAWAELFDGYLVRHAREPGVDDRPFTAADYRRFVDGKPRLAGVLDFLAARGISLPWGSPSDGADTETVCGLGNRKNEIFHERIARDGVPVFESSIILVKRLQNAGIDTAVFSSSRNCSEVLRAAGIGDLFTVQVDGVVAENLGLAGKPDPAVLFEAARRCGAHPARCVVIEDSEAGIAAGRTGGFALVIGVDRGGAGPGQRGAHVVVADLAAVEVREGDRRMSQIPDALVAEPSLSNKLEAARPAVFLDFDGTISEIVSDPAEGALVDGAASALTRLAAQCPVAVISGRDLVDIQARIGLPGIWYAGSHGFELVGPDGQYHQNEAALGAAPALDRAVDILVHRLRGVVGVLLEHKRFGVAVHYRNVDADRIDEVVGAVGQTARELGLRVTNGRKVTELRPDVDWDKGRALLWVLDHVAGEDMTPIYIGDDLTDEDAFDALPADGIGIVVRNSEDGDRRSAAQLAVNSPTEVRDLLRQLADRLDRSSITTHADDAWTVSYDGYDPATERLREALCAVGNGLYVSRGAAPEARAGERHYPGTYAAGVYNRLTDHIGGMTIDNESLVNLPNWLPVTFRTNGPTGAWFDIDTADLLDYRQELDLRRAVLLRTFRFRDAAGRVTSVQQRRFVAMNSPHVFAMETTISAENWSGRVEFRSVLDGAVRNTLVDRYRDLASKHIDVCAARELSADSVLLEVQTNQTRIPIAMAARSVAWSQDRRVDAEYRLVDDGKSIGHDITVDVVEGIAVTLEKVMTVFTGRDPAISEPADEAARWLVRCGRFTELLDGHALAWKQLWEHTDIELEGHAQAQRAIRLHLLHLMETASNNTTQVDAGVPARGLNGEAYRGHIFWDELFVFPVLNLRMPALTRSLLDYRIRRLPEARSLAAEAGYAGAMFPWQSGSDGREESQQLHLNPQSGRWNTDPSQRQHHIGIAVAYNIWQYYQVTGDLDFLAVHGAEMLVEIARFYVSLSTFDEERGKYVIKGVIGPDEFHSGYPGRPYDGIDNNSYTNVMTVWVILRAMEALELIPQRTHNELLETLHVDADEMTRWETVSRRMFVPFHDGVISQFEGYDKLAELDWESYRTRYGNIGRLDRILEAEGDDVNRYRVSKQADVKMLFYLLSAEELRELFERLGYEFPPEAVPRTVDYYMARTSHGSTLSAVVHAWILARANRAQAMDFFDRVLASDIADVQGGTTAEGIHLAAMAGSIDLLQRCFSGLETRGDRLLLCPNWPEALGVLKFSIFYRGHRLQLRISGTQVAVTADDGSQLPIEIECRGHVAQLRPGDTIHLQ
jgi:alpha,alpha-trehalase